MCRCHASDPSPPVHAAVHARTRARASAAHVASPALVAKFKRDGVSRTRHKSPLHLTDVSNIVGILDTSTGSSTVVGSYTYRY